MLIKIILKYWKQISISLLVIALFFSTAILYNRVESLTRDLSLAKENIKAYKSENDSIKSQNRVFKFTMSELKDNKDSITNELLETKKKLKIKDSKIISMQYYIDKFLKTDTVKFKDTVLVKGTDVDTLIGDKHYSLYLHLVYPNKITTKIGFTNKKEVFVSTKKETIDPPYKFFLWRWFQKKQEVAIVDIYDSNPYLEKGQSRFIQIVNKNK